jgi:type II secretory pathway component GspD/PulD (secretin)
MIVRWFFVFFLGMVSLALAESKMEVEVFPLGLSDFETAEKIATSIISPDGKLVADKKGNRLIVLDYPEKREALRQALANVRPSTSNVRIKVSFTEDNAVDLSALGVLANGKAGPLTVHSGDGQNSGLQIQKEGFDNNSFIEQELVVMNGGQARLRIGTNIPYADWIFDYGCKKGFWIASIRWKEVGAQMLVEPHILEGNQLRIKLTPELSYIANSENQTIAIEQLSTEVIANDGQELNLGGLPGSDKEFYMKLLAGFNRYGEKKALQIKLKPMIEQLVTQ